VIDGKIGMLQFDEKGKNARVLGVGENDPFITLHFDGNASPQTIELNFASTGEKNGLFQVGDPDSIAFTQDGYPPGVINSVSIGLDGTIQGVASNGTSVPIAQMAVAFFENEKGLLATGDNYYVQSLNSGDPQIGEAGSGSRGFMQGGSLETANVDVALEFTQLIIAQRGFSANARTITVSSEVLEELTNIVR
jgi:flagellar hook protein FlgE